MKSYIVSKFDAEEKRNGAYPISPSSISGHTPVSPTEKLVREEIRKLTENAEEIQKIKEQIEKKKKANG